MVLRVGVAVSLSLLLAGLVVQLASGHYEAVQVPMFHLAGHRPLGEFLMGLGVLALTLTPACSVIVIVGSWIRQRDSVYIVVGIVVIAVLATSVIAGLG